ncbi:thiol S-methyltransferase TMT1B-like isoform X2 [Microplitis mediator]|uniref:thiol S-methyltransferase TMT1B-like isoform X2 n=1 Tax=Microplitis mediator TaxID=375433 RepID=UPI002556F380|nr:thiol S-methyltransferase TMT1B-like isoform X2 [Microplitis mediator]
MAACDISIRNIISIYGSLIIIILLVYYFIHSKWCKLTNYIYRLHLVGFESECAEVAVTYKKRLFESLNEIQSSDKILRFNNCIRVLEIGVKIGQNIQFYPNGTHLIGVDWNYKLKEYLTESDQAWQFSHIIIEKIIIGDGSYLKDIPDNYVDAVVTTRSLCSVASVPDVLCEIHRVLAPGGIYLFFEHIPDEKDALTRWLQGFLTKTKIWPSLFGDCRLDSNPLECIQSANFKSVVWEIIKLRGYVSHPYRLNLTCYHIMGTAKK